MILHGRDLIIKADGTVLAASKSCTINTDTDIIKVSSPDDGGWEHSIAGRKAWSVQTNHLLEYGGYNTRLSTFASANNGNTTPQPSHMQYGMSTYQTTQRGLNMMFINLNSQAPSGQWHNWDTYLDDSKAEAMEEYIANLDRNFLAVIVSYDAFGMTSYLKATIEQFFYVDLSGIPIGSQRGALAVIGGYGIGDKGVVMYAEQVTGQQGNTARASLYLDNNLHPVAYTPLRDAVKRTGREFDISVQVDGFAFDQLSGKAICKSFKAQATLGNLLQGSFSFIGNGPLE